MQKKSILNLQNKIKQAAQDYYTGNTSISDEQFDSLVDKLKQKDPSNTILDKVGWGVDVDKVKGDKITHKYGLVGSLTKIHSITEIPANLKTDMVCLTSKLDGASCVAYYKNGSLQYAVSRGNGSVGIDKTKQFEKIVKKYKLNLRDFTGAVRGEIVFSNNNWNKYDKTSY